MAACGFGGVSLQAPAAGAATAACGVSMGSVIARTSEAVVVGRRVSPGYYDKVYACLKQGAKRTRLDTSRSQVVKRGLALSGHFVLFQAAVEVEDGTSMPLLLYDLKLGRLVTRTDFLGPAQGSVGSSIVKRNGAFAWIQNTNEGPFEVFVCRVRDCAGENPARPVRVDAGGEIDLRSLRREGSAVVWRNGQAERSSPL
jgi:hypothetical protein